MNGEIESAVEKFLRENYPIGQVRSILPVPQGLENRSLRVQTHGADLLLRIYSQHHSTAGLRRRSDIQFELEFMAEARRQGVPAPDWIRTRTGTDLAEIMLDGTPAFAVLFRFIEGEQAPAYNQEIARAVAETLIRLRRVSQEFSGRSIRPWPGDMAGLSLAYYRDNRPRAASFRSELDALYTAAVREYDQLTPDIPTGVIHGDIKLENILFAGNTVRAVLDFDDYRKSVLVEELARTVMHDLDSPDRNVLRSGQFDVFQTHFHQAGGFSHREQAALKTFLKARFLYDVATYLQAGLTGLVEELFADPHIAAEILS